MNNELPTTEKVQPPEAAHRRRSAPWILGGTVLLLLAIIVAQQVFNLWAVVPPDTGSDTLLLYALSSLNFAAFVVFSFILVRSVLKLRRERREHQLGSKIKTRLLIYFITLSLLPITAMAAFSYLFLNRSLEKWFHNFPEEVVKEAKEFQTETVQRQVEDMRGSAALLAAVIREQPPELRQQTLERLVATGQLVAIEIAQSDGTTIAKAQGAVPAQRQDEVNSLLARAHQGEPLETLADGKGFDLVSIPLGDQHSLLMIPARRGELGLNETISGSQSEYQHLVNRQRKVRLLGLSTLGLMTLMLLFASTWVAIHLARGIATPIKSLAEAANEVARGNLAHRVSTVADDELALLAESFNQMTEQLDDNRRHIEAGAAELRDKNLALNERRNYIETVLDSLSTGVISLDESDHVTTMNAAAATMLRRASVADRTETLADVISADDRVLLERLLRRARRVGRATEQAELSRGLSPEAGALPVALTATALGGSAKGKRRGVVLVMEDLSELLAAQRAAAWSEVARRMAHEIKNPLTPIQLSAERIARNFRTDLLPAENGTGNGDGNKAERARVNALVEECTSTISREVAGLKAMVDEFSRFARLPHPQLEVGDLNEVVRQAAALYEDRTDGAELRINLAATLPEGVLDQEQMRRVFVNLIDNSLAAFNGSGAERRITITTSHDVARDTLVIEVADTGEGISPQDLKRLFQPYFSTRERGTGLGLAIVHRIITEHGGRIRAEANQPLGAKFVIELPAASS
jgi:nitrogen fixation/metabolism regulation signal transduction histidine kinase